VGSWYETSNMIRARKVSRRPVIGLSQRSAPPLILEEGFSAKSPEGRGIGGTSQLAPGRSGARRPLRVQDDLEFIRGQLARQPARMDMLRLVLGGSVLTVALIELSRVLGRRFYW